MTVSAAWATTLAASTAVEDRVEIAMLITCSKAVPQTCFGTSNSQTLIGLRGRSLHRLKTRDKRARIPRADCTTRAKGPSSLHSPLPASACLVFGPASEPSPTTAGSTFSRSTFVATLVLLLDDDTGLGCMFVSASTDSAGMPWISMSLVSKTRVLPGGIVPNCCLRTRVRAVWSASFLLRHTYQAAPCLSPV